MHAITYTREGYKVHAHLAEIAKGNFSATTYSHPCFAYPLS